MEGFREDNLRTVREEVLREREELEELRARAKVLERRRREMMIELEEAQQAKEKAEEKRREAEERWRSKVEEMEEEQELKLKDLSREIQRLKEREEEKEEEWRSRMEEVRKEVEESRAALSSTRVIATAVMLEEQKTQISSLAAEGVRDREKMDRQRRSNQETDDKEKGRGGEVSRRPFSFSRNNSREKKQEKAHDV